MNQVLYALVALVLLALAAWLARLLGRRFTLGVLGAFIVAVGLVYDNGVIAAGALVGEGPMLQGLNWPRYWIHALATPLLILFAGEAAARAGLGWARRGWVRATSGVLVVAMIAYGLFIDLPSALQPYTEPGNVLAYEPVEPTGPPVPPMVTNLALIAAGIALWAARPWPWLGVASIAALVGFGLGPLGAPPIVGQGAEVVLIGGIAATEAWLQRRRDAGNRGAAVPAR